MKKSFFATIIFFACATIMYAQTPGWNSGTPYISPINPGVAPINTTTTSDLIGIGNPNPDAMLAIKSGWTSNNCFFYDGIPALKINWVQDPALCAYSPGNPPISGVLPNMVEMFSYNNNNTIPPGSPVNPYFFIGPYGNVGLQSFPVKDASVAIGGNALIENSLNMRGTTVPDFKGNPIPNFAQLNFEDVNGKTAYRLINNSNTTVNCLNLQLSVDNVSQPVFRITSSLSTTPRVLIGNTQPINAYNTCALGVDGDIVGKRCVVQIANWADDVFDTDYKPISLTVLSSYIQANHHLPDVPTTKEVQANGADMGAMNALLLRKVEELTLYVLGLKNDNEAMKLEIDQLKKE